MHGLSMLFNVLMIIFDTIKLHVLTIQVVFDLTLNHI